MKELLIKLIQAESTADKGELAAAEIISAELAQAGIESQVDIWDQNRANIIARLSSGGSSGALVFACHLDVVGSGEASWKYPAFEAVESGGKIYGRGATDMKGGIAAIVTAIKQVVDSETKLQGDLIFVAAAGEETDSAGAERFIHNSDRLPQLCGIIIPEPTDFSVVTAHRGMLWLEITTTGKAAHSSTPQLGVNAISSMQSVLNELDNFKIDFQPNELLGRCSMSINTIAGGKALNVVPDKCSIGIDIRTIPGQNYHDIITNIEEIFAGLKSQDTQFEAKVSVLRQVRPLLTDNRCDFVRDFCSCVGAEQTKAVGFTTDGPYFASLGAPVVIFGPGKPDCCHQPDEYIEISDLQRAVEYYEKIILHFLT